MATQPLGCTHRYTPKAFRERSELIREPVADWTMEPGQEWRLAAICASMDGEIFFSESGPGAAVAKAFCNGDPDDPESACPVRAECLNYALSHKERFGVWGGLSDRERRRIG